MLDTILFDLDGTLLPMDMDLFMKTYIGLLAEYCTKFGYNPKKLVDALWRGTGAMVSNDGSATNETVFWDSFAESLGDGVLALRPELERFYENEFHGARVATRPNPMAAPLVRGLRAGGLTVVLATNPLFPMSALVSRLSWLGLSVEDFDHITCYSNSHFCKPNPEYFREILRIVDKQPENCLMVGNDVDDDGPAAEAEIDLYFVTDDLLNKDNKDVSMWESGNFAQCCATLERLAANRAG